MEERKMKDYAFRPSFIEPENMDKLGYELIKESEDKLYLEYRNKPGLVVDGYGTMCMHKRIIYFSCEYNRFCNENEDDCVFMEIKEDGGTRRCFHGVIRSEEDFKLIHKLIR